MRFIFVGFAIAAMSVAQTPKEKVTFEVASVKPAAPPQSGPGGRTMIMVGMRGGPGSPDPSHWTCTNCNLKMLLAQGYNVKQYQLTAPTWMDSERYDISAKVPDGATKDQFGLMIQNLLEERFKVAVHGESKEMAGYDLVVAKGGPKMTEHVEEAPKNDVKDGPKDNQKDAEKMLADLQKTRLEGMVAGRAARDGNGPDLDKNGYPKPPKGCKGCMMIINGKATMSADGETMDEFAAQLTNQVGKPVSNATGLTAKYDFSISFDPSSLARGGPMGGGPMGIAVGMARSVSGPPPPSSDSTPISGNEPESGIPLVGAIQSQLGLKLEAKKQMVDMVVIDRAEKVPTEN